MFCNALFQKNTTFPPEAMSATVSWRHCSEPLSSPGKEKRKSIYSSFCLSFGADYGARTRHLNLGKVALYQMS